MKVEPQGIIRLCKTPLESDYKNQLTFVTKTAQIIYFNDTVVKSFDENTYIRKDGALKVNCNIEEIRQCNYLFYTNMGFDNRTYYCFITKLKYVSENSTLVEYETDVFQTYMFDIVYHPCFIEREHVADDTVGLHTIPEPLETGEYEIVGDNLINIPMWESNLQNDVSFIPCFCVTEYPSSITNLQTNGRIQGDDLIVSGGFSSMKFFATFDNSQTGYEVANTIMKIYENDPSTTSDAIKNIFMVPTCLVDYTPDVTEHSYIETQVGQTIVRLPFYAIKNVYRSPEQKLYEPDVTAGNYHPRNNKLFSYPFSYFYITNNAGVETTFKYEDFPLETLHIGDDEYIRRTATYQTLLTSSTGIAGKLFFKKYKGYTSDSTYGTQMYNYGIPFAKLPTCAWTTDYYTNWLTQNAVNNTNSIITQSLTGAVMGGSVGGIAGALIGFGTSFLGAVTQATNREHIAQTTPDQAKGDINTGDFQFCFKRCSMTFYSMSVRREMAQVIDQYFDVFGYKVNSVKTPELNTRPNWNYIKTIGCNVEGNIPQEDINTIRKMFDTGVTLWHHAETMYDYTQNNKN